VKNSGKGKTLVKVELKVDKKEVPLNKFVQQFIDNTVNGMVSSLRGIPKSYGELTITILRTPTE